jgi:hypothetical protein
MLALMARPAAALALDLGAPVPGPSVPGASVPGAPVPGAYVENAGPLQPAPGAPSDPVGRGRALTCLAEAVYYEAGGEPLDGRRAVAQVVLNRVRHPLYPKSVCAVVFQGSTRSTGCQFTFTCDGAMRRAPDPAGWRDALEVAAQALDGFVESSVGASTHYHALTVRPAWAARLEATRRIGGHQFYSFPGRPGAATVRPGLVPVMAASPPAPQPAQFSVWGLAVAALSPGRDGRVNVSDASASP